jgi:hypothetical protein
MKLDNIGYRLSQPIFAEIWRSVRVPVGISVYTSIRYSGWDSVRSSVYTSIRYSVENSVGSRYESR